MSTERDELASILHGQGAYCGSCGYEEGQCNDCTEVLSGYADAILAAGYRKPRTIESAYEDYGPATLPPLSVVLSGGKPAIRQHDGTWMDYDGSSWDDWEMEYPMTVIHEQAASA